MTDARLAPPKPAVLAPKRRSLQAFLTRLILLCIVPLVLVAGYLAFDQVRRINDERDLAARQVATTVATAVDQRLGARIAALQMLSQSPLAEGPATHAALYQEALGFMRSFGSHVLLADTGLQMLFRTACPTAARCPCCHTLQGTCGRRRGLGGTGQAAVGDSSRGPSPGRPWWPSWCPCNAKARPVRAAAHDPHRPAEFQQDLEAIALPSSWSLVLQDSVGGIVATRGKAWKSAAGMPSIASAASAAVDPPPDGIVTKALQLTPWAVRLDIPAGARREPLLLAGLEMAAAVSGPRC